MLKRNDSQQMLLAWIETYRRMRIGLFPTLKQPNSTPALNSKAHSVSMKPPIKSEPM